MRIRRTPTSNRVFALPGGTEDNDAWAELRILGRTDVPEDDPCVGMPAVLLVFELDDDDRARIAAGENLELNIVGTVMPPVMLSTTSVELGKGEG